MAGEVKVCYTSPELTYGTDELQGIKKKKKKGSGPSIAAWLEEVKRVMSGFLQKQKDSFIIQLSTQRFICTDTSKRWTM